MFDAERLLGNLVSGALGGRGTSIVRSGAIGSSAGLGLGLPGVAVATRAHYRQNTAAKPAAEAIPPPASGPPGPGARARSGDARRHRPSRRCR